MPHRQRGASIVEAVIALPVLLVVILGAMQFALVYEAKATLNHASLQAARLGAVRHAEPDAIRRGLARGLVPLASPDSSLAGVAQAIARLNGSLATDARIRILNPTKEAFADFGVDVDGKREIPNERLHTRSTAVGAQSGINIQDANLLKVQITYGYELKVPLVNWFIARVLLGVRRGADPFEQQLLRRTRIPIVATATVRMQSTARLSDAVASIKDTPELPRIPSDAAPPATSNEPQGSPEDMQGGEGVSQPGDSTEPVGDSSLDEGFFGFGSGRSAAGGTSGDGSSSGGSGGGLNGGNPQSCSAGGGNTSPFPTNPTPPGESSPVPQQPGLPPWTNSGATLGAISLNSLSVGNPIHVVTGNKYQVETDIESPPGALSIGIQRHYNSSAIGDRSVVGAGWRLSYDARLRNRGTGTIEIVQADGRLLVFSFNGSRHVFIASRAGDGVVTNEGAGYRWSWPTGRQLTFDENGRLVRMREGADFVELSYDDAGALERVRDSQHRELRFEYYANGRLATIRGPATVGVRYTYDEAGNLEQAVGTDGTTRRYYYEDLRHVNHLTGIAIGSVRPLAYGARSDLQRLATWRYDAQGRAIFSSHPDDAGKVTLEFSAHHTDVTDAFGRTTRYVTQGHNAVAYVSEVMGPGCGKCGQSDASYTYNARFQPLEIATKTGGAVRHKYDDLDRLVRSERIVAGDAQLMARYHYDGDSARPTRIERPSIKTGAYVSLELAYTRDGLLRSLRERGFAPIDGDHAIERKTTLSYDVRQRLIRIDGPRTDVRDWTDIRYDEFGRVTRLRSPAGDKHVEAYDALGRPTLLRELGRPSTRVEYDTHGRVTKVTQLRSRAERSISYRYNAAGSLEEVIDSTGRRQRYAFDAAGRPNRLTRSDSDVVTGIRYAPDDSIERIGAVGGNGQLLRTLYYSYDADRRLTEVRDGDGQPLQQLAYIDGDALPDRKTDPLGNDTWFGYDAFGQLASVLAPDGGFTRYAHDASGRLASLRAPNDATTAFEYDDFGRRVVERSDDRGVTHYRYDAAGNLIEKLDARGIAVRMRYDAANRLIRMDRPEGTTRLTYTNGLVTRIEARESAESFEYDADAQLVSHKRRIDEQQYETRFTYDPMGRMETRDLPSGARLRYRYSATGALQSITHERWRGDRLVVQAGPSRVSVASRLDPLGRFVQGNGVATRTLFDARSGHLVRRDIAGVAHLRYRYDEAGRIVAIEQDRASREYLYDAVGRLVEATTPVGNFQYAYDTSGNRISALSLKPSSDARASLDTRHQDGVFQAQSTSSTRASFVTTRAPIPLKQLRKPKSTEVTAEGPAESYRYDERSHRLASIEGNQSKRYAYDSAGNPLQAGALRYDYDSRGRATKLIDGKQLIAEYRYNFWGERVQKITHQNGRRSVTNFIYEQQKLIAEADDSGTVTREYIYLDHHPFAVLDGGEIHWIHTDHLGTPIAVTNTARQIVWRADYQPFGEAIIDADPDSDRSHFTLNLRFPGQYADAESGTHYNYFRDYDPSTGRYLTPDPLGVLDGTNLFGYVQNNPLSGVDSLGLYQQDVHYYMTLFLAITAGVEPETARSIALASAFVDENASTRPVDPGTLLDQALSARHNQLALVSYHFVLSDYTTGQTIDDYRNSDLYAPLLQRSPQLQQLSSYYTADPVYASGQASCDRDDVHIQFLGEYLHAFADMFSHRDENNVPYNAWAGGVGIGHGLEDGSLPDYTYNEGDWSGRGSRTFLMELRLRDEIRGFRLANAERAITDRQLDTLYAILKDFNATREDEQTTIGIRGAATADERWINSLKVETLNDGLKRLGYTDIDLASPEYRFDVALARERRERAFRGLDAAAYPHAILK